MHPLPDGPVPHNATVFPRPNWVPSMGSSSSASSASSNNSNTGPMRRLRRWSIRSTSKDDANIIDMPAPPPTPPRVPSPIPEAPAQPYVLDLERQAQLPVHVRFVPTGGPADNAEARKLIRPPTGDEPKVRFLWAMGMLVAMAALAGVTAEYLVGSIDGLTESTNVSREFVGLILLPVIGNAVEHVTAVTVSVKDKLNLSMSIAVGSSIQVSLCILPILVLIGWAIGQPMMLFFDTFET
jgi:Ca2+:H+ antiporter